MKIKGIEGMSVSSIQEEILRGGKFVTYSYCISFIMMSMKRSSDIYFVQNEGNAFLKGTPYTFISLLLGWWGIPWGIIYTFSCLFTNTNGGKVVTNEVMLYLQQPTRGHVFEFEMKTIFAS